MYTEPSVIIYQKNQKETFSLTFLDILLDETLIEGDIYVSQDCFSNISTLNRRLPAKQLYELVLRLAEEFPVYSTGYPPQPATSFQLFSSEEMPPAINGIKADCYIAARYKKILLEQHLFDPAIESIIEQASVNGCRDEILSYLSGMLQEDSAYQYMYLGSQPFLIYTGAAICYNILNVFAEELGNALRGQGYPVEYFDLSTEDFTEAFRFIGKKYQAVIGFQSYMFSVRLNDNNIFLHDKITGPKYNFVFDHPALFKQHLKKVPQHLTIFTPDRNYAAFAREHYPVHARFFPPAGIYSPYTEKNTRDYDLVFIGSYCELSQEMKQCLNSLDRPKRFFVNRLWLIMRKSPSLTFEEILAHTLRHYQITATENEFLEWLYELQNYFLFMVFYFRKKILKTLIDSGIQVNVFGRSWQYCPLRKHPNFIWHNKDLTTKECLSVWQRTKISLNIMSWHKDAITERILNSMLQGCAVVTEENPYMKEAFLPNREVVLYQLSHLDALPRLITSLLRNPDKLRSISKQGYEKARQNHTWNCRAKELLAIVEEDTIF